MPDVRNVLDVLALAPLELGVRKTLKFARFAADDATWKSLVRAIGFTDRLMTIDLISVFGRLVWFCGLALCTQYATGRTKPVLTVAVIWLPTNLACRAAQRDNCNMTRGYVVRIGALCPLKNVWHVALADPDVALQAAHDAAGPTAAYQEVEIIGDLGPGELEQLGLAPAR